MAHIKTKAGELVQIYNDNGLTQAMVSPTTTAPRKEILTLFANPNGGSNVVSPAVNELIRELRVDLRLPEHRAAWTSSGLRAVAASAESILRLALRPPALPWRHLGL